MTSASHDENDREELLVKLLTGEIDPKSEEGRRMLDRDPDLYREYMEVKALPDELDGLAAEEADAIDALSNDLPPSLAVDRALKAFRDRKPRRLPKIIPLGISAAALVAIGITLWLALGEKSERPIEVLGGEFKAFHSTEAVERHEFRWDAYPLSRGEEFFLFIDTGDGGGSVWHGTENSWNPSPEQEAELPDRITWWVEVLGLNADYPTASSSKVTSRRK